MPFDNGPFETGPLPQDDDLEGPMADEANWPAGYLALGEQLRDDGNFLADRYPAGAPPALLMALAEVLEEEPAKEGPMPVKSAGWTLASLGGAALALAALAAVAVMVVPQWFPQDGGAAVATQDKETPSQPSVAVIAPVVKPVVQAPEAVPPVVTPENTTPVELFDPMSPALFEELSGPEREGLLDLLEQQPQGKPRVSI